MEPEDNGAGTLERLLPSASLVTGEEISTVEQLTAWIEAPSQETGWEPQPVAVVKETAGAVSY